MAKSYTGLWSLLGSFLGSCLGVVLLLVIAISMLISGVTGAVSEMMSSSAPEVSGERVLVINLDRPIVEKADYNPFEGIDLPIQITDEVYGINQIRNVLGQAAKDPDIKGVLLRAENPGCGYAKLAEIKGEIEEFRENSSKLVYAYGETMTEKAYYLACSADKIFITPAGLLEFRGLRTELLFFKGLFEKLDLEPVVFRVGKYKSAVEPFLLDQMSDENRMQVKDFLEDILASNLSKISEDRALSTNRLREVNDQLLVRNVEDAVKLQLIDGAKYYDEVIASMYDVLKIDEDIKTVDFIDYFKPDMDELMNASEVKNKRSNIAVLVAEGEIVSGKGYKNDRIGSTSFIKELRKTVKDSSVKAIVLRINSPGGSALASDVMWREIMKAKKVKPVICSMSDVAASGGYYMAMACDHIFAQPNTITGSIGVFGLSVELDDFLKNKLGITTDRVTTGEYSDLGSPLKKMSEQEFEIIQKEVERIYEVFTSKAAKGRNMSLDDLQEIASGRVWSGVKAKEIGLVDQLGGLNSAVDYAAEQSGLSNYEIKYYPEEDNFFQQLSGDVETSYTNHLLEEKLGASKEMLQLLNHLNQLDVIQARLPVDITIE